ncbi:EF-hand domain-containing family member B [Protopterus annectens]|uniref:EF-hand domain-containing family member B n=1 Tax=Protopterus annectens TaxID=7888 RepID=UPI001CF98173|nr:EF-hand domain-containing family member B [Protopterus annectens]
MPELKPIYEGKFIDRSPTTFAAGKLIPVGERAAGCLAEIVPRPLTPPVVKKFRNTTHPKPSTSRIFYGKANDPDIALHLVHGISTRTSLSAGSLVNPPPKTLFEQKLLDRKEFKYGSHVQMPLGRSHEQTTQLPYGMGIYDTTFGRRTIRAMSAREIVNPSKSREEVDKEAQAGHQLYSLTHNDYNVGEIKDRKYDWSKYRRDSTFGMETPHFNDGRNVAKSLRWLHELQKEKATRITSKRANDFRERSQHQLGKVLDPIADTLNVPPNHTFGIMHRPDEFGAGDLIHNTPYNEFLRGKDRQRAVLSTVRQHLKKANYHNFNSLLEGFRYYDKKGDGKIDKDELWKVCEEFHLDLEPQLLDALIEYCDVDGDGLINFVEFVNFLNWKDKLPLGPTEEQILMKGTKKKAEPSDLPPSGTDGSKSGGGTLVKPEDLVPLEHGSSVKIPVTLTKPRDRVRHHYQTSSSMINAVVGRFPVTNYHTYGVPTVRSDLAAPRIKRISDSINYGDESSIYGLLSPSLFANAGVYEKDFFIPRSKAEVARIFHSIGVDISADAFNEVWKQASMRHPKGEVSVETFRNVLSSVQAMNAAA